MKQEEFRNIFNNIKYTEEFKAKMRRMISEEPEKTEYSQSVEGVEIDHRSRIVHTSGTIAACAAVAVALGVAGYNMRGMFSEDEVTLSSPTEQSTKAETTKTETTEAETTEAKRSAIFTPYTDLYGKSDEELLEIGKIYYEEAIRRYNLNQQSTSWTDLFELDYEKVIEPIEYTEYYLIKDENIKTIDDINEVYYSVFVDNWDFERGRFIEQEDGLYYNEPMGVGNIYYNGYDISFEEATEEIIRYTVTAKFNDGVNYETVAVEVPLEFSLVPTDEGWKVNSFINAPEAPYELPTVDEAEEVRQQLEELEAEKQEQQEAEAKKQIQEEQEALRKEQEEAAKEALLNATEAAPYAWAKEYIGEWRSNYGIDGYKLMIYSVEADIMKFRIVAPDGTSIGVVEGVLGEPVAPQKMVSFGMASDAGDALQGNLYLGDNAVYISIFSDPTSILPTELNFPIHAE